MKFIDIKKEQGKTLVKLAKKGNDSVKGRCEGFSLATFGISKKRIGENAPKIVVKAAFGTEKKDKFRKRGHFCLENVAHIS